MILFVDDNAATWMSNHIDELVLRGWRVELAKDADEAIRLFEEHRASIELVVLDVMIPAGNSFTPEETEFGSKTGLLLVKRFREAKPDLPVVVLTNVLDEEVMGRFRGEHKCECRPKWNCSPLQLEEIIEKALSPEVVASRTREGEMAAGSEPRRNSSRDSLELSAKAEQQTSERLGLTTAAPAQPLPESVQRIANVYIIARLGDALMAECSGIAAADQGARVWRVKVRLKTTHEVRGELVIGEDDRPVQWQRLGA